MAEAVMRFLLHQAEACTLVNVACGVEAFVRPQSQPPVAALAGEFDAFGDQPFADAIAAGPRLYQQQAQFRDLGGLFNQEDAARHGAAALGNPAALLARIEILHKFGYNARNQRLKTIIPSRLLGIERAMP